MYILKELRGKFLWFLLMLFENVCKGRLESEARLKGRRGLREVNFSKVDFSETSLINSSQF